MSTTYPTLPPWEVVALEAMIEKLYQADETKEPAVRRRDDVLGSFKYLQRIKYGSMEVICQTLAYKYYYRPRSVYALVLRNANRLKDAELEELKVGVDELMYIRQQVKSLYWMESTRRHEAVRAAFRKWQNLGDISFLCRLLGYMFYYRPETVRQLLKEVNYKSK
ncbi:hypothetical protein [Microscilla marina]|uniref:Uncharacterized protein n=1 Tax=Microscilla marina ATCC 23134 TaxID=313606 RepID=A1ZMN0_MICM2|nr:hypothetical protein [Microscilla marina]EAY28410.1 hypothetical protein M23134_03962 [Microscilla marina ATCC 23134]